MNMTALTCRLVWVISVYILLQPWRHLFNFCSLYYSKCPKILNTLFRTFFTIILLFMLFLKILSGMANSFDSDQTASKGAVWSGSALFAYVILSETLVYEILGYLSIFAGFTLSIKNADLAPFWLWYPLNLHLRETLMSLRVCNIFCKIQTINPWKNPICPLKYGPKEAYVPLKKFWEKTLYLMFQDPKCHDFFFFAQNMCALLFCLHNKICFGTKYLLTVTVCTCNMHVFIEKNKEKILLSVAFFLGPSLSVGTVRFLWSMTIKGYLFRKYP